jgi:hypothetical protein
MSTGRVILAWAPRLLLILFALFLVIFSFDVFEEGKSATQIGTEFFIHNIPSMILGLVVFAAWRREWIGALVCVALALAWVAWAWQRFPLPTYLVTYLAIPGPLIIIAALYAVNWRLRSRADRRL